MFSFQSIQKDCWNGQGCYYLSKNRCNFYHPPSHYFRLGLVPPYQIDDVQQGWLSEHSEPSETKSKQQNMHFEQNGTIVVLIPIQTNIQDPGKAWFFQNARHFQNYLNSGYDDCSICLENFKEQKLITKLYCNHYFHKSCIEKWISESMVCPLCKKNFTDHKQYEAHDKYQQYKDMLEKSESQSDYYDQDLSFYDDGYYDPSDGSDVASFDNLQNPINILENMNSASNWIGNSGYGSGQQEDFHIDHSNHIQIQDQHSEAEEGSYWETYPSSLDYDTWDIQQDYF